MRRMFLLVTVLPLLAGCDQNSGPLPHALAAMRAGDYDEYLAAKQENDEVIKGAIHADDDLCLTSPKDFTKYAANYSVQRLDHKELYALPEEERLAYAIKVAAQPELEPGHFLEQAPVRHMSGFEPVCQGKQEQMMAALQSDGGYSIEVNEGRLWALKNWIADLKSKHGDQMDEKMREAIVHLETIGYSGQWPPKSVDFGAPMPTFSDVAARNR